MLMWSSSGYTQRIEVRKVKSLAVTLPAGLAAKRFRV